jgi:hypothetical protein
MSSSATERRSDGRVAPLGTRPPRWRRGALLAVSLLWAIAGFESACAERPGQRRAQPRYGIDAKAARDALRTLCAHTINARAIAGRALVALSRERFVP